MSLKVQLFLLLTEPQFNRCLDFTSRTLLRLMKETKIWWHQGGVEHCACVCVWVRVSAWGLIKEVENKASKICSCSWICVPSNERGFAAEMFQVMLATFYVYHSISTTPIAFLSSRHEFCGTAVITPAKLTSVQCFLHENLELRFEKYCCPYITIDKQIPFSHSC